jgi:hypothetical protein
LDIYLVFLRPYQKEASWNLGYIREDPKSRYRILDQGAYRRSGGGGINADPLRVATIRTTVRALRFFSPSDLNDHIFEASGVFI